MPVAPPVTHNLQTHYEELLKAIAEVGKDVKPAYTNSKISADRLKRSESYRGGGRGHPLSFPHRYSFGQNISQRLSPGH